MPLLMRKYELEKKGHKIRAWVNPPPHFRAMPELKPSFSSDVFPYCHMWCRAVCGKEILGQVSSGQFLSIPIVKGAGSPTGAASLCINRMHS